MAEKSLAEILKKRRQISITVIGRRTGREITLPVWFVSDDKVLWLLPVYGAKTQWYRNLEKNRAITIQVGRERHDLQARLLKDPTAVRGVIERFNEKYTAEQIKRWYTGLDAAIRVPFAPTSDASP
jgi:deazaflavin-dependent oxidoreductase (nitroreductase family)